MNACDLVNELMKKFGLSETDLAEIAGCSQPTINRIRRGLPYTSSTFSKIEEAGVKLSNGLST